jgi:hypothetical protein
MWSIVPAMVTSMKCGGANTNFGITETSYALLLKRPGISLRDWALGASTRSRQEAVSARRVTSRTQARHHISAASARFVAQKLRAVK